MLRAQATLAALAALTRADDVDALLLAALDVVIAAVPSDGAAITTSGAAPRRASLGEPEARALAESILRAEDDVGAQLGGERAIIVHISTARRRYGTVVSVPTPPFVREEAHERLAVVASQFALALDRLRLAEDLTRSRDELAAILENVTDGITATSATGELKYANRAAARLAGFDTPEEHLRVPVDQLLARFDLIRPDGTPFAAVARRHGGRLSVAPALPGSQGARFVVLLPAATRPVTRRLTPAPDVDGDVQPGRGRVLVMDDDASVLQLARVCLEHLGYDVEVANDGTLAAERYAADLAGPRPFDAVILDLTVPGGEGGLAALQRLRELDPNVRAIVSSGYSNDPVMARYQDYGFKAVLPKPYRLEDMARVMRKVLPPSR